VNRVLPSVALTIALCACHGHPKPPVTRAPAIQLPAPAQVSPTDNIALHGFPRMLTMQWTEVLGAAGYGVEVDCYGCCASHDWCSNVGKPTFISQSSAPIYTHEFVGDQPGRWRVWAISADGTPGSRSGWRTFTYGKVYEGNIIPPVLPRVAPEEVVSCPNLSYPTSTPGATLPKAIYIRDPEYTEAARKAKITGTVVLGVRVGEDGLVKDVCIQRSLRPDLDANAIAAVKTWRFEPARKSGTAIPGTINVETTFQLR
jgi:TonB family protein